MLHKKVRKIRNVFRKINYKLIIVMLSLATIITGIGTSLVRVTSNSKLGAANQSFKHITDPNTMDSYKEVLLSDKDGSRYAGRIWSDKTVLSDELTLDMDTDGYNGKVSFDADFLNVLSALGSSQAWIGLPPTKTVIVIDNSGSMYDNNKTDWTKTRMDKTVNAVNKSIDSLMRAGAFNEVAIAVFGNAEEYGSDGDDNGTAKIIVPMGHYEVSDDKNNPYHYLDAGWGTKNMDKGSFVPAPMKSIDEVNKNGGMSGGFIYVDKRYINDSFNIDESISTSDSGSKRYRAYRNGNTNINAGNYVALKALLNEETTVKVAGYTFNYIPSVVVLSDGAATDMLKGSWSNPEMEKYGYTNDRGDKNTSIIGEYRDAESHYTFFWNMLMEIKDKDGVPTFEQIGYGDKTLTPGHDANGGTSSIANPGPQGEEKLKEFAYKFRSTQGTMILQTLLNGSYMKNAVEKKFDGDCKFYTVSVDMINPTDINIPEDGSFVSGSADYKITTNPFTMGPGEYFNLKWLQEKGYIKPDADLDNLQETDLIYEPYTIGSEIILGVRDAIAAYNEYKNNKTSFVERNKLNTYIIWSEISGLYDDMKNGQVTYKDEVYKATNPIGPNHSNAILVGPEFNDIKYNNLVLDDPINNPYNITDEEIDFDYVTKAYYASSKEEAADKIEETFDRIIDDIIQSAFTPVGGMNDIGVNDAITYMDPIGQYMDVKNNSITIDGKTYDIGLLLFGKIHGMVKTAVYDYTFNSTHRGPDHNSSNTDLGFTPGWYDSSGKFLGTSGSWDNGDTYYLDGETVREYVPTLDEKKGLNNQQMHTIYTLYRFLDDDRNMDIHNPCYNDKKITYKLSDIRVWVEDTENFVDEGVTAAPDLGYDQAIYINIPVSALPLQVSNVEIGTDGHVASYTTNLANKAETTPLRLFYSVGIQDKILTDDGLDIDLAKISPEYIKKNKVGDVVYFYSNYYSNTSYDEYVTDTRTERTRGDAYLSFSPSETNRFYMYQNPLPLYKINSDDKLGENGIYQDILLPDDETMSAFTSTHNLILNANEMSSDDWYYVILDYYMPGMRDQVHVAVVREGKEFGSGLAGGHIASGEFLAWYNIKEDMWEELKTDGSKPTTGTPEDWVISTKPGGLRVGDMAQSLRSKSTNATSTAYNYYLPTISSSTDEEGTHIVINSYLGNNGRLEVNDSLMFVTKEVEATALGEKQIDPNKEFDIKIKLEGKEGDFSAIKVTKNPYSDEWQLRVSTIDILTDNKGFLQDISNNPAVYRSNGQSYYIYIGDNKAQGDTGGENVFRLYSSPDNGIDVNLTLSGMTTYVKNVGDINSSLITNTNKYAPADSEHAIGSLDFWVKKVYLIPSREVDNGTWKGNTEGYASLNEFVIAHLDSYLSGSNELSSPYATQTSYLTTKVYFGYADKPEQMPEGWDVNDWNNQEPNIAHIKLKNNEGILFSGLKSGIDYETEEIQTLEDRLAGYYFDHIVLTEGDVADVEGAKVKGEVQANYIDEVNYFNNFYSKTNIELSKETVGLAADRDEEFTFNVTLTPAKDVIIEDAYQYTGTKEGIIAFVKEGNDYKGTVKLKAGDKIVIENIPEETTYKVEEVEANQNGYSTSSDNATGKMQSDKVTIPFVNTKLAKNDLTISKIVEGQSADKNKDWDFNIILKPLEGSTLDESYEYTGSKNGSITFTIDEAGNYVGTVQLKDQESITIHNIPEYTNYEIVEKDANQDGYITLMVNDHGTLTNNNVQALFRNIKYSRHKLTLSKNVTGGNGDKERLWNFNIILRPAKDVIFDTVYKYTGTKNGQIEFKEQDDGSYLGTISLTHNDNITISNIPERTTYEVVELEADKDGYETFMSKNKGALTDENTNVTFINRKLSYHDLKISKEVVGAWGDTNALFDFEITFTPMDDVSLEQEYPYEGTKNGTLTLNGNKGTIKLKSGDSITIKGIPEGTKYVVKELSSNTDGYTTTITGTSEGALKAGVPTSEVLFKNAKYSRHSLSIAKEVVGYAADKTKEWDFTIKLTSTLDNIEGEYPYVGGHTTSDVEAPANGVLKITDGIGHVKLKHGQMITLNNLPEGLSYEIVETEANQNGYVTTITGKDKGKLPDDESQTITFTNTKYAKYDIDVSKVVNGTDQAKEWTFKLTLNPGTAPLESSLKYVGSKEGTIDLTSSEEGLIGTFTLKPGEKITIKDVPETTTYKVEEVEANQDGYQTTTNGKTEGILKENDKVDITFVNTLIRKLTIKHYLRGNYIEMDRDWHIQITFKPTEGMVVEPEYTYVDEKGEEHQILFEMQADGSYVGILVLRGNDVSGSIDGLPYNLEYEIIIQEANQDGYKTTITNEQGNLLEPETIVPILNERYIYSPNTLDNVYKDVILFAFALLMMFLGISYLRRKGTN